MTEKLLRGWRRILGWANYKVELLTQIIVAVWTGAIFGIMESIYIDTAPFSLPLLGRFSWYHAGLLSLMFVISATLCISNFQRMARGRKLYLLWSMAGSLPLALWVEDVTWFLVRMQPISRDEWTMIQPGWGINFGVTWIPYWYFVTLGVVHTMFWLAHKQAKAGLECQDGKVQDLG